MELRHLRNFTVVAETCHFGRAAERLHMAQPALSQAIRHLETELGAPLFTRTTRQVALTPAGEYLLGEARRALSTLDASVDEVRRIADGKRGTIRVAFTGTATLSELPGIARTLRRHAPDVTLQVHSDLLTGDQCERLREGRIDIGILRPPIVGDGISVRPLLVEPLVLALPDEHRLAAEPAVTVADLRTEEFIRYASPDSVVDAAVVRSCRVAGFTPNRAHDAAGTAVMLALVAAGLGIAVLPASARALPIAGVTFRSLPDAEHVELGVAWRSDDDSAIVHTVLDLLLAAAS